MVVSVVVFVVVVVVRGEGGNFSHWWRNRGWKFDGHRHYHHDPVLDIEKCFWYIGKLSMTMMLLRMHCWTKMKSLDSRFFEALRLRDIWLVLVLLSLKWVWRGDRCCTKALNKVFGLSVFYPPAPSIPLELRLFLHRMLDSVPPSL